MAENVIVLGHVYAAEAGVYAIELGFTEKQTVDVETLVSPHPVDGEEASDPVLTFVPTEVDVIVDTEDIVFAAADPRWFVDGKRRPHDEVAAEQRGIVKAALAARAAADPEPTPEARPLPGGGGPL